VVSGGLKLRARHAVPSNQSPGGGVGAHDAVELIMIAGYSPLAVDERRSAP